MHWSSSISLPRYSSTSSSTPRRGFRCVTPPSSPCRSHSCSVRQSRCSGLRPPRPRHSTAWSGGFISARPDVTRGLPLALAMVVGSTALASAQPARVYTRADTLRGSYTTPGRAWWDVTFYDLHVAINPADSSVRGYNRITYRVLEVPAAAELQIDLMRPLAIDSVVQDRKSTRLNSSH